MPNDLREILHSVFNINALLTNWLKLVRFGQFVFSTQILFFHKGNKYETV